MNTEKELVQITWADGSDWPWFYLLEMRGEWLHLQGADYPDGSEKHDGDCFWVHKSDVAKIKTNVPGGGLGVSAPCNCEAYDFPHRPMSGDCHGHDLADCPSPTVVVDPYCTGDRWYLWVEHGCRKWADIKPRRDMPTRSSAAKETV
jgi:hypothetical protein